MPHVQLLGPTRIWSIAMAAVPLLGVLPSLAQQAERHVISGSRVAVYNLAGEVEIRPGSGSDVVVTATRGGADSATLRVERGTIGGRETLRFSYPGDRIVYPRMSRGSRTDIRVREDGTFGGPHPWDRDHRQGRARRGESVTIGGSGQGREAYADLVVAVPEGQTFDVYLGVGNIALSNVSGTIGVDASSASVTAEGIRGAVAVDVGSGSVRIADVDGETDVDTGSGSVSLSRVRGLYLIVDSGSGSVSGSDLAATELSIDTGSGDIELSDITTEDLKLDTGSGDVDVALTGNTERILIDTGSGDVTLAVPPTLGAALEIDAGSGDIESDLPLEVTRWGDSELVGRIGDGGGRIEIDTGSGDVRFVRAQ